MSYRDDHDAAIARIDALERDNAHLASDKLLLEAQLTRAREWLGGPRKRLALLLGGIATGAALAVGGFALGRSAAPEPPVVAAAVPPAPSLPATSGTMLGWDHLTGPWTIIATRCARRAGSREWPTAPARAGSLRPSWPMPTSVPTTPRGSSRGIAPMPTCAGSGKA